MVTATKFMKFCWLFCFRYNSSLTNNTQFGNDSNNSKFNGENIATSSSRVTVFALDGLTKKHFGHYALLKIFPSDHQVDCNQMKAYCECNSNESKKLYSWSAFSSSNRRNFEDSGEILAGLGLNFTMVF